MHAGAAASASVLDDSAVAPSPRMRVDDAAAASLATGALGTEAAAAPPDLEIVGIDMQAGAAASDTASVLDDSAVKPAPRTRVDDAAAAVA